MLENSNGMGMYMPVAPANGGGFGNGFGGDGDGRYNESRDNFRDSSYRGRESYENPNGYSRDKARTKMVEKLSTLMDDTMSEHERNAIMDCINKIK